MPMHHQLWKSISLPAASLSFVSAPSSIFWPGLRGAIVIAADQVADDDVEPAVAVDVVEDRDGVQAALAEQPSRRREGGPAARTSRVRPPSERRPAS
jgi:hypothetical protein